MALNHLVRNIVDAAREYVLPETVVLASQYQRDDVGRNARSVIEALRRDAEIAEATASVAGSEAIFTESVRHTRRWTATVATQVNIDVKYLLRDDDLVDLLSVKSQEFNRLIKNLSNDVLDRIERQTLGAIFEGRSNADIAKALQEIHGIGRNRARLIARDQASKLNGAMNQFRQEQAGVTHYTWRTILDGRERPSHHANNGKTFAWAKPPATGHPSSAVNCRCRALAVLTDDPEDLTPEESSGPLGDFFETNLPSIREIAKYPSQANFNLPLDDLAARKAVTNEVETAVKSASKALTEAEAERLVKELYGFLPANADIDGLAGGLVTKLMASRKSKLMAAALVRIELISQTIDAATLAAQNK